MQEIMDMIPSDIGNYGLLISKESDGYYIDYAGTIEELKGRDLINIFNPDLFSAIKYLLKWICGIYPEYIKK